MGAVTASANPPRNAMTPPTWRTALRAIGLACIIGAVVAVRVLAFQREGPAPNPIDPLLANVTPIAYLVPGIVLLLRRQWHVVGWLLSLFAVGAAFSFGSAVIDDVVRSGNPWTVWLIAVVGEGSLSWLPIVALLVVFPDGLGARTIRQRTVGRIVVTSAALAALAEVLAVRVGLDDMNGVLANPLPVAFVPRAVTETVTVSIVIVALVVAFTGMVRRYRRSHATARRQYRWVLSSIVLVVVSLFIGIVGSELAGDVGGPWWYPIQVSFLLVPIAFMVAILRYRLYEIDRLVSRTVTYTVVVVVLAGIYLVTIGMLTQVLPSNSDVAVAASTLTIAALFRPLQQRVRRAVDRHFNRIRFDAERELERFARHLRDQTDLHVVEDQLSAVVTRTLQPTTVGMWTRQSP